MHRTIDEYLDLARVRQGIDSDRKLAAALKVSSSATNQWRTKRAWPADDTMIDIAEMAGIDPATGLDDLDEWRAKTPRVAEARRKKAQRNNEQFARLTAETFQEICDAGLRGYLFDVTEDEGVEGAKKFLIDFKTNRERVISIGKKAGYITSIVLIALLGAPAGTKPAQASPVAQYSVYYGKL